MKHLSFVCPPSSKRLPSLLFWICGLLLALGLLGSEGYAQADTPETYPNPLDKGSASASVMPAGTQVSTSEAFTAPVPSSPFITRWDLSVGGTTNISATARLNFDVATSGTVSYTWQEVGGSNASGSGTFSGTTATITGLPINGTIDLSINPTNFQRIHINDGTDRNRLTDVRQWGSTAWTSMAAAFAGCGNLNITATDLPNLAGVNSMYAMFASCTILNGPSNINSWDVSAVSNMASMFYSAKAFNQAIGGWNIAAVTDMKYMFLYAFAFNQSLGAWGAKFNPNVDLSGMLDECGMSVANYDATLTGFSAGTVTGRRLGAEGLQYCAAVAARDNLVTPTSNGGKGWTITGDALSSDCRPFITRWDLSVAGSAATSLSFDVRTSGTVFYTWQEVGGSNASGSGTFSGTTATITGLPTNGTIDLSINPTNFQRININYGTDSKRLTDVKQWGSTAWTSMETAFYGCERLNITATDLPNLAGVSSMWRMFAFCTILNGPSNINSWDVSAVSDMGDLFMFAAAFNQDVGAWNTAKVTDMSDMFRGARAFNQDIGAWNTAKVTNMSTMFRGARAFNQAIGGWKTDAVTNMYEMFSGATAFNQAIGGWNTAKVTNMSNMFNNTDVFNQAIGGWNTAAVTDMSGMFNDADAFNQDIGGWKTDAVTDMSGMFNDADAFNQDIGGWKTGAVTDMSAMFAVARAFNQNIGSWDVRNVTNMRVMFANARAFNQAIGGWNTAKVTNMERMFVEAFAFNQDVSAWNIAAVTDMQIIFGGATTFNQNLAAWGAKFNPNVELSDMLSGCGMSVANYDATLTGFSVGTVTGRTLGANGLQYCSAVAARDNLVALTSSGGKGWTIIGDVPSTACLEPVFTGMPSSVSVCAGLGASFAVTVSNGTTYAWQVNSGSGFVNLTTGGVYSGVNTATLRISNVTGLNGYQYRCVASNTNGNTTSDAATLTVVAVPTISVSTPAAQCGGSLNLSTAFSSVGTLSYFHDDGLCAPAINPVTSSGTYFAQAVSGSCLATASVVVTIRLLPTLMTSTPAAQCGGSINLNTAFSSNGTLSYFSNSGFTSSATNPVTASGTYYARAVSSANCSATSSVAITINPSVTISVSTPAAQCGGSLNLSTAFSSNGTLSYFHDDGLCAPAINPVTSSGTYFAQAVSGSCLATASVVVTIRLLPTLMTSTPAAQCGGSINLSTAFSSNGTLSYFSNSGFTSSATNPVTASGTYYARAVSSANCSATSSVAITINPSVTISVSTPAAQCGGSLNLSTAFSSNGTLSYFSNSGFTSAATNPVTASGTYYARAIGSASCSATASVAVTIINNGGAEALTSTPVVCVGGNISLSTSSSGSGYTWSGPVGSGYTSNSQSPTLLANSLAFGGVYSLTVQFFGGCSASATVSVEVRGGASVSSNNPVCAGNTLQLSASGGDNYSWAGPSFSSTQQNPSRANATTAMSGRYSVTIRSTAGCTGTVVLTTSVVVSARNAIPTITGIRVNGQSPNNQNTVPVLEGRAINFSVTASNAVTYSWRSSTGFSSTLQNPSIANASVANAGQYVVVAQNGCQFFGARTVNVAIVRSSRMALSEAPRFPLVVEAYPNPTRNNLTIRVNQALSQDAQLRVVDVLGREVHFQELKPQDTEVNLSVRAWASGVYVVSVEAQGERASVRVHKD